MAQEAELKISSKSVERSTIAIDALITALGKLGAGVGNAEKKTDDFTSSQNKVQAALAASQVAALKASRLHALEAKGLSRLSDEYATIKGAILAKEIASKKGIKTDSKEYEILQKNMIAREKSTAGINKLTSAQKSAAEKAKTLAQANKKLADSQEKIQQAVRASQIESQKATRMYELEKKGLDKLSDSYARQKGAILAKEAAQRKGIKAGTEEYAALKRNIIAREKATAGIKRMEAAQKKATREGKKLGQTTQKFTDKLDDATRQMRLVDGPLGGIASRMSALSQIVKSGALAMAGFAIAGGLLGKFLISGALSSDRVTVSLLGLEAQLKATGYAAGFTTEALEIMARGLAKSTLDNTEGVLDLIGVMASFGKVNDTIFKDAISLSQDLGLAMRQSPITAARTLGKVLENPLENYKQLKRAGIEFGKEEKKNLKIAQQANDLYAAQKIIIDNLKASFEGVAASQTDSLAGDVDTFSQDWLELSETLGKHLIPTLRAAVQYADFLVVAMRDLSETGAETSLRKWKEQIVEINPSLAEMEDGLVTMKLALDQTGESSDEMFKDSNLYVKTIGTAITALGGSQLIGKVQGWFDEESDLIKGQIEFYEEYIKVKKKSADVNRDIENEAADKLLAKNELTLKQQRKLTAAFIETGSTRSLAYRQVKVGIDTENALMKVNIGINSVAGKKYRANMMAISGLTEARVKHNIVLQKTKSILAKSRDAEREIELFRLTKMGIKENSQGYMLMDATIRGRNSALSAGFAAGTKEYENIVKQTEALSALEFQLQTIDSFKDMGFSFSLDGDVLRAGTEAALQDVAETQKGELFKLLMSGNIDMLDFNAMTEEINQAITDGINEIIVPVGMVVDLDGNEELLSSLEAVAIERDQKLRELDKAFQDGWIEDIMVFNDRKAEINRDFDTKETQRRQEIFEKSAEHMQRIRMKDTANSISQGLATLSAVADNNKKLAKMAKLASMFGAATSLVDSLSQAAGEPYPLNIALYAKAFAQGTQLVQQAASLKEPSFAFGGVDIQGDGTGRSDDIKARISSGESVVTQAATSRHKETLKRMNSGLPVSGGGGGGSISIGGPTIVIQGDASSNTLQAIDERLVQFEDRVAEIARGESFQVINEENEVGGIFDPI